MLAVLLFLLLLDGAAAGQGSYWIVIPQTVAPGEPFPLAFTFHNTISDVVVQVDILDQFDHSIARKDKTFASGSSDILTIQIPYGVNYQNTYSIAVRMQSDFDVTEKASVKLEMGYRPETFQLFVQTDKAVYKPGQTVNFRAFGIFSNMSVYTGKMNIFIYDPKGNKIRQWLDIAEPGYGVVENFMPLDTEPMLGDWRIQVDVPSLDGNYSKNFTIDKYVLPKFEVSVELPPFILTSDRDVKGSVKAKYTYGEPVVGTVKIKVDIDYYLAPWRYEGQAVMLENTFEINGEAQFTVPLDQVQNEVDPNTFISLATTLAGCHLIVVAEVIERLNNVTRNGSASVQFYDQPYGMTFSSDSPRYFKPGLPYKSYLLVHEADGRPVISSEKSVEVRAYAKFYDQTMHRNKVEVLAVQRQAPPSTGILTIRVNAPIYSQSLHLEAHFKGISATLDVEMPSFNIGNGALQIFMNSSVAAVGQNAMFEVLSTEHISELFYMVIANNQVVYSGKANGLGEKSTFISFGIREKMQPFAQLVVYYCKNGTEWNADSTFFNINDGIEMFKNKVSLHFDQSTVEPGDRINLQITTDPRSLVNILAVDQSVLLKKTGNDITGTEVISSLKSFSKPAETYDWHNRERVLQTSGIQVLTNMQEFYWLKSNGRNPINCNYATSTLGFTTVKLAIIMQSVGIIGHSPTPTYGPFPTLLPGIATPMPQPGMLPPNVPGPVPGMTFVEPQLQHVHHSRTYFPETWLWTNITSNDLGEASVSAVVPDTITSWVASAFSVNKITGLGVTFAPAKFRTYRPFFVSLTLPYSVVRGEELVLQANVFNYMALDMNVVVTLDISDDFKVIIPVDASGNMQSVSQRIEKNLKVASGKAESVLIPIVPVTVGKIDLSVKAQSVLAADGVKRQLLVEPEGAHKEYNYPFIIAAGFNINVPIILPPHFVADSLKIRVHAIGDIMGLTLKNLNNLLQMPSGCGEQTMINLAPDVFVINYLKATHQLTDEIRQKVLPYMETGYQRELTFQHKDGSFSVWGEQDGVGSIWLTAFVLKSFHQAKKHIYVSEDVLKRAINWMLQYQNNDGSFQAVGSVIHSELKGGASAGDSLTAFCIIALLENDDIEDRNLDMRVQIAATKARIYLESHVNEEHSMYELAIVSYALAKSGSGKAKLFYNKLDNKAIVKDDKKFWSTRQSPITARDPQATPWSEYYGKSSPIDIEIAAYALLYYIEVRNFVSALPVLKWLVTQRNSNGGFQSTQDTVLALQAMSEYGRLISDDLDLHLNVATLNFIHNLTVQQIDKLVLKTTEVPVSFQAGVIPELNITATGKGATLVQVHVSFNDVEEQNSTTYNVSVNLNRETLRSIVVETCVRWTGTGSSGMTVVEIGIPTGFEADFDSSRSNIPNLKKREDKDRRVVLYFDQFDGHNSCMYLEMIRRDIVAKSQSSVVRVYDYYEPGNRVVMFYESTLLKGTGICGICGADCGCTAIIGK